MDLEEAKRLMAASHEVNTCLNKAAELVNLITDPKLQADLRRSLGLAMSKVYLELMHPVIRQFPELDPDPVDDDQAASE